MSHALPFNKGDRIVELGGGQTPLGIAGIEHFNVDKRPLPTVDAVRNLEEDFTDIGKFDGLYASYIAEHISWRKIEKFFHNCHTVLKNGGVAVFIVPNTFEQLKLILSKPELTLADSCMLFGDQDYSDNTHKVAFSKPFITKLLKEAGFDEVKIFNHPNPEARDMIIEAHKKMVKHKSFEEMYDRAYFEDPTDGYVGFWDFPSHFNIVNLVADMKPESILDVGAARGYVIKHLEARGIGGMAMDVSPHCFHTRATDSFVLHDATVLPWPFKDKEFDLVLSMQFMEHIPEKHLDSVIREMERVSKRGYHTITFEITPQDIDTTHRQGTIKPYEWWVEKFKTVAPNYPTKIMSLEEAKTMNRAPIQLPPDDGLVKINFGSHTVMFYYGWINSDISDLREFASKTGRRFTQCDVRQPLPFAENSVDCVVAHHLIEHLTREEGAQFLKKCLGVLKPNGVIRLSTPDLEKLRLHEKIKKDFSCVNPGVEKAQDESDAFFKLVLEGHETLFSGEDLKRFMVDAGFVNVEIMPFNKSRSKPIQMQTLDSFPTLSVYVEGEKPIHSSVEKVTETQPYQQYLQGIIEEGEQRWRS